MECNDNSCAVCGAQIDANNPPATAEYQGQTYCCCCDECAQEFNNNPQNYAMKQAA